METTKQEIIIGGLYRHYKNHKLYRVLNIAEHTESGEPLVVYIALYDEGKVWARPLSMFAEFIMIKDFAVPRFKLM